MFKNLPKKVKVVEVGPRDGLQNEPTPVPTSEKLIFIKSLIEAGVRNLEVTSFVRPDRVPQMSDASRLYQELIRELGDQASELDLCCLVPNLKGMEKALECNVDSIALFAATSETFSQKNINCTIEESKNRLAEVAKVAREKKIRIRGYVSTAFGCPYEGETSVVKLAELCQFFIDQGASELSIGDTIGVAHPLQVFQIVTELAKTIPLTQLAMHFHNTRKLALANIVAALEAGVEVFDSSAGGLGGCPYAPGASGNVATEELLNLFAAMGIETGIDLKGVSEASQKVKAFLQKSD